MCCEDNIPRPRANNCESTLYGIPRGTEGREVGGVPIAVQGIVLHCTDDHIGSVCNEAKCRTSRSVVSNSSGNSFHFGIGGDGALMQFVDPENVSWSFGAYKNASYPDWPHGSEPINWPVLQAENPEGITPDAYTVNIILARGTTTTEFRCTECPSASGLPPGRHKELILLLAWIVQRYDITLDADHLTFRNLISCTESYQCDPCYDLETIIEEIGEVCFPCEGEEVSNQYREIEDCDTLISLTGVIESCCPDQSAGCLVTVPFDNCFLGSYVIPGDIEPTTFVGLDSDGCLVSDNIDVLPPIIGDGTDNNPFRLDLCLFGDWIPDEPADAIINLVGIDVDGCLIESTVADVIVLHETHLTVIDTDCINLTVSGTSDHTLQADIVISSCLDNLITCQPDGLCVQFDCDNLAGLFDPGTIVNLYGNDGAGACVVQDAQSVIEDAICLIPEDSEADPIWVLGRTDEECPVWVTPASVVAEGLVVLDTETVNLTLNDNVLSADVIISPAGDNILTTDGSGLYVPPIVANGSDCIDVVQVGQTFTIAPIIAPAMGGISNVLTCTPTGLYVPRGADAVVNGPITGDGSEINPLDIDFTLLNAQDLCDLGGVIPAGTLVEYIGRDGAGCLRYDTLTIPPIGVDDTDCIDLDLTNDIITATPVISGPIAGFPNALFCTPTGLYVGVGAGILPTDTDCIDLEITAPGILTATLIVDPIAGNQVVCGGNGLFVPLGAGITVDDTDCIDMDLSATGVITATPIIAPAQAAINNVLQCIPGQGLYVPETVAGGGIVLSVADTACITLNVDGGGELTAEPIIAPAQLGVDNALSCIVGQGLYVPATEADFIIGTQDGDCTDIDVVGGVLVVDVVVAPTQAGCLNSLTCTPAGLFVPQIVIDPSAGTTPAGGNIVGIDVDCDGVNDIEFCEGFEEIVSGNTCETGAIGSAWMLREFSLSGKTLTVESAPEHTTTTIGDILVAGFLEGDPLGNLPDHPIGTVVQGPTTAVVFTNDDICRDMVVTTTFTGFGADISLSSANPAVNSIYSYALQYQATINGGPIVNPEGTDHILTSSGISFATFESDGTTLGFVDVRTLAPGQSIIVEITPQMLWSLQQLNLDLSQSRLSIDDGRLSIVGTTV